MGAIRSATGATWLAILVLLATVAGANARAGEQLRPGSEQQALPELEREALLQCVADERESRELLERHQREAETVAASGRELDAQRRDLAALRASIDLRDGASVDRYNARAAAIDARVQRHNAGLASLAASRRAQQAVAQRYNSRCGGRHFQPNALRPKPGR